MSRRRALAAVRHYHRRTALAEPVIADIDEIARHGDEPVSRAAAVLRQAGIEGQAQPGQAEAWVTINTHFERAAKHLGREIILVSGSFRLVCYRP